MLTLCFACAVIAPVGCVLPAAVAGSISLPANYPVPVYPGAQTTSFSGGSMVDLMSLTSKDGIDKVVAWYESPKASWRIEGSKKKNFQPGDTRKGLQEAIVVFQNTKNNDQLHVTIYTVTPPVTQVDIRYFKRG